MGIGAPTEFGDFQGAVLNMVTKSGSNQLRATLNGYWFNNTLVDSDIGFEESEFSEFEQVHPFRDLSATLSGAIKQDRLWYFAAYRNFQDGLSFPGQDPATLGRTSIDTYDLKVSGRINDRNLLELRGGYQPYRWPAGADEFTKPSAAGEEADDATYWGLSYQSLFSDRTFLEARYSGWESDYSWLSQTGSTEAAYLDYSPPDGGPARYFGGMWWPNLADQSRDQVNVTVSHFADDFLAGDHDFKFGVQVGRAELTSRATPSVTGGYYAHFYGDLYYRVEGRPLYYGNDQETWSIFVDDSWALGDRLTLNLGLRFDQAEGKHSFVSHPQSGR